MLNFVSKENKYFLISLKVVPAFELSRYKKKKKEEEMDFDDIFETF